MYRLVTLIKNIGIYFVLSPLTIITPVIAQQTKQYTVPANIAAHPAPNQPIPYRHKQQLTLGLSCENCHTNPGTGVLMGFPDTDTCMACHNEIAKDKATIVKLQEYAQSSEAIPWQRVYKITEGITWNHKVHTEADVQCETCHGNVRESKVMAEETAIAAMATCISCHQAHEAKSKCETCHAWPMDEDILSSTKY